MENTRPGSSVVLSIVMKVYFLPIVFASALLWFSAPGAFAQDSAQTAQSPGSVPPRSSVNDFPSGNGSDADARAAQLMNSARQLTGMGRKLDAIDMALRAAKLAPNREQPPLTVAVNLMDIGRWDEAAKYCRSAIDLNNSNEDAAAMLTAIYFRAETPEAIAAGQTYLSRFPAGRYTDIVQMQIDEARKFGKSASDSKQKAQENYLRQATVSGKNRWQASSMPLKVFIATENGGSSDRHDLEERVCRAFRQWQDSAHGFVSFIFVPDVKQADIECTWSERANDNMSIGLAPGTRLLDWTSGRKPQEGFSKVQLGRGCIVHASIELRKPNLALGRSKALDMVELSALHEIGHTLGLLEHSDKPTDVLCQSANLEHAEKLLEPKLTGRDGNTLLALYRQDPQQYNLDTRYSMDLERPGGVGYMHCPTIDELLGYPAPLKVGTAIVDSPNGAKTNPKAAALYRQAEALWATDDPSGALKLAEEAGAADKNWHKPHLLMAMCWKQLGDLKQALEQALIAIRLGSFDEETWLRTAGILLKGEKFDDVLQLGHRFYERFPSSTSGQKEMLLAMGAASQRIALRNGTKNSGPGCDEYFDLATAQGRYRWPVSRMPLKVFIADGAGSSLYNPEFKSRLLKAFEQWRQASNGQITWRMVDSADEADVECRWDDNRKDSGSPDQLRVAVNTEPDPKVVRGTISHAWISLVMWSTKTHKKIAPDAVELQSLQQVGHILGLLGRSSTVDDIMYDHANTDVSVLHLSNRDKRTLQMLYK